MHGFSGRTRTDIAHILIVCGAHTCTPLFAPARIPAPAHFLFFFTKFVMILKTLWVKIMKNEKKKMMMAPRGNYTRIKNEPCSFSYFLITKYSFNYHVLLHSLACWLAQPKSWRLNYMVSNV